MENRKSVCLGPLDTLQVVHMAFNPHLDTNMAKFAICVKDYIYSHPPSWDAGQQELYFPTCVIR